MSDKHVIFDFDGTLADTIGVALDIYNNDLAPRFKTKQLDKNEIPSLRKLGYKKVMKLKGVSVFTLARMLPAMPKLLKQRMGEVEPYDSVIESLLSLKSEGYGLGVLTSNDQNLVTAFLESHGFPEFDCIVHERAIFGKDRALNKIVKRHHLDKAQTVYVGDEPRDIQAAHKAGLKSIGVSWGVGGRESLEPAAPTILIDDAKDLLPVVREILPQ